MTTILIAGLIVLVLVISVVISTVSHRKEQLAAELRQRAAEFRARVHESQELLDCLQNAGVDTAVRAAIMERIAENLTGLRQCEPTHPNLEASIRFAREQAAQLRT